MSINFKEVLNFVRDKFPDAEIRMKSQDNFLISEIFSDSRDVIPGSIFCCIKGEKSDGHNFINTAIKKGAVALLCEREINNVNIPQIIFKNAREVLGEISALIYDYPCEKLLMIGVTGTNGKTTTTYIIRSILESAGIRTGILGTIIESDGINEREADRTTPESCIVQKYLNSMVQNKCGACVMETSSHGLFLGRLDGTKYDIPIFTNLYPEHLDFHVDMQNYFEAKKLLFSKHSKSNFKGAANSDNEFGKKLLIEFRNNLRGFGHENIKFCRTDIHGTDLIITMKDHDDLILKSPLVGDFNVMNTLCAVTAIRDHVSDQAIINGVANVPQIPGRLERINLPDNKCCFVDFAHTPSALETVLKTVRNLNKSKSNKIISVFGHGGGRYELNRPELGRVASEFADEIIITSDNARDEDPLKIAQAIKSGIKNNVPNKIIIDRPEAVNFALNNMSAGDILVITGKGPEKFITIKDKKIPFNDSEAVKSWAEKI